MIRLRAAEKLLKRSGLERVAIVKKNKKGREGEVGKKITLMDVRSAYKY